jgi:hypothetical protein
MKHKRRVRLALMKEQWARTMTKRHQAQDQLGPDKVDAGKAEFIALE